MGVRRSDRAGYMMILPYYLFLIFFIMIPIVVNLFYSFTSYDLSNTRFIGLGNYAYAFEDEFFLLSLRNTAIYAVFTLALTMVLALLVSLALNQRLAGRAFYRTAVFLPYVISMVSASMIWLWLYDPSAGVFNDLLKVIGLQERQWLFDARLALPSIIVMSMWKLIGYNVVVYLSGLQAIPSYLYESATMDGAGAFQRFIHITLPMLRPIIFFLFITGMINNFNVFEQVQIMTGGGPLNSTTTIVHQIYNRAFHQFQFGYASSLSTILLVVVVVLTVVNFRFGNQGEDLDVG